ncbi:MAG TPA: excinuclease ABC subunit UvrC [Pseudomonadales bacterium]
MTDEQGSEAGHPLARSAQSLPHRPGVYRLFDARHKLLYIGKAKDLNKRVSSYFRASAKHTPRLAQLVSKAAHLEVTITESEVEALLLEQNLIKQDHPPFNILLRDDKSYPYIFLSTHDAYPRLALHRGARRAQGEYFGPYPSAVAARDALSLLQKFFQVRQCDDSFFSHRSRPCLQHQIGRCTAPCVELVNPQEYADQVRLSRLFLEGKSDVLIEQLSADMRVLSEQQAYEKAADVRDRIQWLREVQTRQGIEAGQGNLDVVALHQGGGLASFHVLFVREGRVLGSRNYTVEISLLDENRDVLGEFLAQFYLTGDRRGALPDEILISGPLADAAILEAALSHEAGRRVRLAAQVRSHRRKWIELAERTALENLNLKLTSQQTLHDRFSELQQALDLPQALTRIECFDISHHQGTGTVAACVVFSPKGSEKQQYRRFTISHITPGDDYAALEQAVRRRYTRLRDEQHEMPSLILIDGGENQLKRVCDTLTSMGMQELLVMGIAKGPARKAGDEQLFIGAAAKPFRLEPTSRAFHLLQQVRDEAHRFAVAGHHQRQKAASKEEGLGAIAGVGPKRKKALLHHFGGRQGVVAASVDDLLTVPGINRVVAEAIYDALHKS